jgi:hypothetical protein
MTLDILCGNCKDFMKIDIVNGVGSATCECCGCDTNVQVEYEYELIDGVLHITDRISNILQELAL